MNVDQSVKKIVSTYISPKTHKETADCICSQLPLILKSVNKVEDLFPLLGDPSYHTDFIVISIEMFAERPDGLDMFDIVHTLSTLIKSTVYRPMLTARPKKRETKIIVVVDETTDPRLIRQVMNFPDIASVGWILGSPKDLPKSLEHAKRLMADDFSHDERVLELLKPKKKKASQKEGIVLTARQSQVLEIIQTRGCSNKHIAKMLDLSESTVKLHVSAIFKKFGVKNRTQLAVFTRE